MLLLKLAYPVSSKIKHMAKATEPQKQLGLTNAEKAALMALYEARAFLDISIAGYQRGLEKNLESRTELSRGEKQLLELMDIERKLAEEIRCRVLPILAVRCPEASPTMAPIPGKVISIESARTISKH